MHPLNFLYSGAKFGSRSKLSLFLILDQSLQTLHYLIIATAVVIDGSLGSFSNEKGNNRLHW